MIASTPLRARSARRGAHAAAILLLLASSSARAAESAYCRKVEARAASEAALLMSPQLVLEGLRVPPGTSVALGPALADGYQARVSVAFSAVDFYRGALVRRLGAADCAQHEPGEALTALLLQATDGARLAGLRAQAAFLEAHQAEWTRLVARAEERLEARVIRIVDVHELVQQAHALERKLVEAQGEADRLAARVAGVPQEDSRALADRYVERSLALEREGSRLRTLQAWDVRLTGGAIPERGSAEWYAIAELRFTPGRFLQGGHEARLLRARADELRSARHEAEASVGRLRDEARAAQVQARRDLALLEGQLAGLARLRGVLELSETPATLHARDALAIEELAVRGDQAFVQGLLEALARLTEEAAAGRAD